MLKIDKDEAIGWFRDCSDVVKRYCDNTAYNRHWHDPWYLAAALREYLDDYCLHPDNLTYYRFHLSVDVWVNLREEVTVDIKLHQGGIPIRSKIVAWYAPEDLDFERGREISWAKEGF